MSIKVVVVCLILATAFTQITTNLDPSKTAANTYTISQLNQYLNEIANNPFLTAQLITEIQKLAKTNNPQTTTTSSSIPSTTSTAGSNLPGLLVTVSPSQQTSSSSVSVANPNTYVWPETDYNCKTYNYYDICIECYTGFFVSPLNLTCTATNPLCKEVSPINLCLSCYTGYNLVDGNCIMIPDFRNQVDFNCKYAINNVCQQCYPGLFLNRSINWCQAANPKCKNITSTNTCSACYDGYILINQDCLILSPFNDVNCAAYVDGICTVCVTRYYLAWNGVCAMVDPFCQDYTSQGRCLLCYIGYQLSNGNCVLLEFDTITTNPNDVAIQCPFRSVPRPGTCLQVSDQCQTWDDVTALCLTCYMGYEINVMGECVIRN